MTVFGKFSVRVRVRFTVNAMAFYHELILMGRESSNLPQHKTD